MEYLRITEMDLINKFHLISVKWNKQDVAERKKKLMKHKFNERQTHEENMQKKHNEENVKWKTCGYR